MRCASARNAGVKATVVPSWVMHEVERRSTSSGAPLTTRRRTLPSSISTETRRRSKSNGASSIFVQPRTSTCSCARMASSRGLRIPVSKWLLRQASASTCGLSRPAASTCRSRLMRASVRVPVLSVHSTSIEPRFWMAGRRFTMTCWRDMRSAPCASVTDTIIGRSSGVSPTASAIANRNDSSRGLCVAVLTSSTKSTISTVTRMINRPNWRRPISDAVGGGSRASSAAMPAMAIFAPVPQTRNRPAPLTIEVPMKTALAASASSVASWCRSPACFSTGNDSPVRSAWLTKRCCASSSRPSAGTRLPARSSTTSPGTTCARVTSCGVPLRSTLARTCTDCRSRCAARFARYSCTKSRITLASTMIEMITKLATSPASAATTLAAMRISTSGLPNRRRKSRTAERSPSLRNRFGP